MMLGHYLPNMRVCAVRAVLRNEKVDRFIWQCGFLAGTYLLHILKIVPRATPSNMASYRCLELEAKI